MKSKEAAAGIQNLRLENISKSFPGIKACDRVSITVGAGEALALVGENGAGKTTLMNILMGLYQPDEGRIFLGDEELRLRTPSEAYAAGIGMVHQHFMLVPNMTVAENVALGLRELHRPLRLDLAGARRRILEISEKHELAVNPDAFVWQLSVGEQQRVELVKTLCLGARFLILDEPTSALTPQETDELIARLKKMSGELSLIFISHKLHEVKALCGRVCILRRGAVVYSGGTADKSPAELAALMTGHAISLPRNDCEECRGEPLVELRSLDVRGDRGNLALNKLELDLQAGEILGIAGVSGNGQRELAEALAGLRKPESGSIRLFGKDMTGASPRAIIDAGMGYIPEDRNTEGIVPSFSIKENLVLKDFASEAFSRMSFLKRKVIEARACELRERFDIRCPSVATAAGTLSGGNIQKVILAREFSREPRAMVAVYPTRGLDMGAVAFIHKGLLEKRKEGAGIILISEELDEIIDLSDRIAVIYKGSILKVLRSRDATKELLGMLMAGVRNESAA